MTDRNEIERYLIETGDFYGKPEEELQMAVDAAVTVDYCQSCGGSGMVVRSVRTVWLFILYQMVFK